jgi:pentatricopeptide repeat protein
VPEVDAIGPSRALNGPVVDREGHRVVLAKRNDIRSRLHTGPLLREHKVAAGEISLWLGKQDRHLNRKSVLPIEVPVEAVVVAGAVLEEQRSGSQLPCVMASLDEIGVALWVALLDTHCFVPAIRDWSEPRIERGAKAMNDRRERIAEVFVFAPSEAVSSHDDAAAEDRFLRIERRNRLALVYMAPEQFESGITSRQADIYSLGLVMFELVTGHRPFEDRVPMAEAIKRLRLPAPKPSSLVPTLEPTWDKVIGRCLELDPGARFENVSQIAELLEAGTAKPSSPQWRFTTQPWLIAKPRMRRLIAIVSTLIFALSLFGLFYRHYLQRRNETQFAARDWILVTDFTNQTGERVFDRVVRDLAVQSLSQSNYFKVVPRLTALEAAKRTGLTDVSSIDEKLGRELCIRENYKGLMTGGVYKEGSRYILALKVEMPGGDSKTISDTEVIQSPDQVFSGIDRIAARIRSTLGESLPHIKRQKKNLAQVTTTSLEALQRYSAALDLYGSREYVRAMNLAKDAIEIDPLFVMAHLLLAQIYEQLGNESACRRELELAKTGVDRVSERERHLILAASYSSQLMNEQASQEYQHLLDIFPDDTEALKGFAYESFWAGHGDQAIAAQQKLVRLMPDDPSSYDALMHLLVRTNRFHEALAVYDQAHSHNVWAAGLTFIASLAAWGEGDLVTARKMLDSLNDETDGYWKVVNKISEGRLLASQGRMNEAVSVFRTGLALVQMPGLENWMPVFQYQIAKAEIALGHRKLAQAECLKYQEIAEKTPAAANLARGASLFIQINDVPAAHHLARLTQQVVLKSPDPFSEMQLRSLQAELDLARGIPAEAEEEASSALAFHKWYTPYLVRAKACELQHKWNCAIESYRDYLNFKGEIFRDDVTQDWSIAHLSLAHVYSEAGDQSSAKVWYEDFQKLFSSGDDEVLSRLHSVVDFPDIATSGQRVVGPNGSSH